jgi:hypothetical protein
MNDKNSCWGPWDIIYAVLLRDFDAEWAAHIIALLENDLDRSCRSFAGMATKLSFDPTAPGNKSAEERNKRLKQNIGVQQYRVMENSDEALYEDF